METETLQKPTEDVSAPQPPPEEKPKYKAPRPPVGLIVQWFHYGQQTAGPRAAMVVGGDGPGTVRLKLFDPKGVPVGIKKSVWYANDPVLIKKDRLARSAAGTWDYIPGTPRIDLNKPLVDLEAVIGTLQDKVWALEMMVDALRTSVVALEPCGDVPQEIQDKILKLSSEGKKSGEIAKILGDDWTHQKVSGVLRHRGEL